MYSRRPTPAAVPAVPFHAVACALRPPAVSRREYEEGLEREADALLTAVPRDPCYPAYTEAQLMRQGAHCILSTDALVDMLSARAIQNAQDELTFLAQVSRLTPGERACLRGWMQGWTQLEMSVCDPTLRTQSQQQISRLLRSALRKCYGSAGLTFAQFSRHAVYRRPSHCRNRWHMLICPRCQEEFPCGLGAGRYCSLSCREAARHR